MERGDDPLPGDAVDLGIALVPEDRKLQALILGMGVRENLSLPVLDRLGSPLVPSRPRSEHGPRVHPESAGSGRRTWNNAWPPFPEAISRRSSSPAGWQPSRRC